jgi:hypothetical protein
MNDFSFLSTHLKSKFPLGQVVVTANALSTLLPEDIRAGLSRHAECDWGDVPHEDAEQNDSAIWGGGRLLSVYHGRNDIAFWVITEADRRTTTVLLPEDY